MRELSPYPRISSSICLVALKKGEGERERKRERERERESLCAIKARQQPCREKKVDLGRK